MRRHRFSAAEFAAVILAAFGMHGLIRGYVFVRHGKLWPLIVSHAILDFYALASAIP